MEAKSIKERARELMEIQAKKELAAAAKRDEEIKLAEQRIIDAFEKEFADYLPMLKADGIKWTAGLNMPSYPELHGGYIVFSVIRESMLVGEVDNTIRAMMDMNTDGTYRYEHHFDRTGEKYATSVFSKWDKDEFVRWIAYRLRLLVDDEDYLLVHSNPE